MKKCTQDLIKNAISPHSKHDYMVRNMGMEKQCIYNFRNTGNHILDFHKLKNVKSTSSMQNILIFIFDKHSRRGVVNSSQVQAIGTKT